jgi:hypothetical protein
MDAPLLRLRIEETHYYLFCDSRTAFQGNFLDMA